MRQSNVSASPCRSSAHTKSSERFVDEEIGRIAEPINLDELLVSTSIGDATTYLEHEIPCAKHTSREEHVQEAPLLSSYPKISYEQNEESHGRCSNRDPPLGVGLLHEEDKLKREGDKEE